MNKILADLFPIGQPVTVIRGRHKSPAVVVKHGRKYIHVRAWMPYRRRWRNNVTAYSPEHLLIAHDPASIEARVRRALAGKSTD